jgi:glycosyltransferase involved in cell wall biosynthesis
MNILFVHQNYPAQYKQLLNWLGPLGTHRIVFLTQTKQVPKTATHEIIQYEPRHKLPSSSYAVSRYFEVSCAAGETVAEVCRNLDAKGFKPDIVIGHTGWGEMLFIRHVWPKVPVLSYFEFFYSAKNSCMDFDPEFPVSEEGEFAMSARNAVNYLSHASATGGQTPTLWQRDTYPESFHSKIRVIHEGIDTRRLVPNPKATAKLGRMDQPVTRDDEIFTYMARNMEPMRGFHVFMRALPEILAARPKARALIIGGNDVSYGVRAGMKGGFRALMEREIGNRVDWSRVHFLGRVPYNVFIGTLQLSRCHVYMTMPFVLSWSMLEAMSMQTTVVASNVAPVREVITDGKNGFLVDFFSPQMLARKVIEILSHKDNFAEIGRKARKHIVKNYDLVDVCMPAQLAYIEELLPKHLRGKL